MELHLIRNALITLNYAGKRILIDPDLAEQHARPSFTGKSPNPTVGLPLPIDTIVADLDLIIVSHLHKDHFDAVDPLPKDLPLICQPSDQARIAEQGFSQIEPLESERDWQGIQITRTGGSHGLGEVGKLMGNVSGFVLRAPNEPTVYWVGDSVLYNEVEQILDSVQPDIVISHSCGASWPDSTGQRQLIVMDAEQTIALAQRLPNALVVATHMEAVDHATVSRAELRAAADAAGIPAERLLIPNDGDTVRFDS
jgi:L-ascorbate metabolism protein UlaG (beta-lactamase superfamily)